MFVILGYLDPGAGATLMQLMLAGTIGIGAIIKLKWHSIRSLFGRRSGVEGDSPIGEVPERAVEDEEPPS